MIKDKSDDVLISTYKDGNLKLHEVRKIYNIPNVIERFGQWVVSDIGIQSLVLQYDISINRLMDSNLIDLLSEKRWCIIEEFKSALEASKIIFDLIPPTIPDVPSIDISPDFVIDEYLIDRLKSSLLQVHKSYKSIDKLVPDSLSNENINRDILSVKEDFLLSPCYMGFVYLIDGFLYALSRDDLRAHFSYETLLNYSNENFEIWVNLVIDSVSNIH